MKILEEHKNGISVQSWNAHGDNIENYDSVISALPPKAVVEVEGVESLVTDKQWQALKGTEAVDLVKICCPTVEDDIDAGVCIQIPEINGLNVQAWQNGKGKGGEHGSLTFYCEGLTREFTIDKNLISKLQEEYAIAVDMPIDKVFVKGQAAIVKDWRSSKKRSGCFFIPTKKITRGVNNFV